MKRVCPCCRRELHPNAITFSGFCIECLRHNDIELTSPDFHFTTGQRITIAVIAAAILAAFVVSMYLLLQGTTHG